MNWGFTINPSWKTLEYNEQIFLAEINSIQGAIWYHFPHYYNNSKITSYWAFIISLDNIQDIEYIKTIYWIEPNKVLQLDKEYHLVFYLNRGISESDYNRYSKSLTFLYSWSVSIDYHFYEKNKWLKTIIDNPKINSSLINQLRSVFYMSNSHIKIEREMTKHNFLQYEKVNQIKILEIAELLDDKDILKIDIKKNLHIHYWNAYHYALNMIWALNKTHSFLNKNFGLDFQVEEDTWEIWAGTIVEGNSRVLLSDLWYYTITDQGKKYITDFTFKAFYKIKKNDWQMVVIVSLEWQTWITEKIEYTNSASQDKLSEIIQSRGNFHFYGTKQDLKDFHKMIFSMKVPEIKYIVWFGFNKEEQLVFFRNWIWDIKQKIFTPRIEWEKYLFNYDWRGFYVVNKSWSDLIEVIGDVIPTMNASQIIEMDDLIDLMNSLYADNTWYYFITLVFGMLWYLLYWDERDNFPIIFSKWLMWSWKSSFNELIKRVYGLWKNATSDIGRSTPFTLTILLSHLIKFPFFLWEYRENIQNHEQKIGMFKSVFDRTWETKWRADQTIIKYDYLALPVLDWQEMIKDGAIRTRCLQKEFIKSHRIKGNFDLIVQEKGHLLDNLLYTYFEVSNEERYKTALREWFELFSSKSNNTRIINNIVAIYAWCMAFDDRRKDEYLLILNETLELQNRDFTTNSYESEIIWIAQKFLEQKSIYWWIYDFKEQELLVISWNSLYDFIKFKRIDLSLQIDTYIWHLEAMGYKLDYIEDRVNSRMIYWIHIPYSNIPKEFLLHEDFYAADRFYKQKLLKWKNTI